MADKNVHLTESDANNIANSIKTIAQGISDSVKILDDTTNTLISGAKGQEIDYFRDQGKRLINAVGDLATCAIDIGVKIGDYIKAMVNNDREAAQKIRDGFNS